MKKLQRLTRRLFYNQRGSAAVVTALVLSVLMVSAAFVMDLGAYYVEAGELQNALDSAVLAAVRELPAGGTGAGAWTSAEAAAVAYAAANGVTVDSDEIEPIYADTGAVIGLRIVKSVTVDFNFARVIGVNTGTVTRAAAACLEAAGGVTGAVPLCVTDSSLRNAIAAGAVTDMTIKCSTSVNEIGIDGATTQGWFGALDFTGSSGASAYADNLAYGYQGSVYVGQVVEMEMGNMSGPTLDGFTRRFSRCTDGCTSEDFEQDCPRICLIPVVQIVDSKHVRIVSFAAFFLEACGGSGNDSYITATYIDNYVLSDALSGISGLDFGVYTVKLTG